MATQKEYLATRALNGTAQVTAILGDGLVLRLDRTLFHVQGGGQRADTGTIDRDHVVCVKHAEDGEVDHHLSGPTSLSVGDRVELSVDKAGRDLNAQYHSAGHMIGLVVETLCQGLKAVQGHHWPSEARVEFEGNLTHARLSSEDIQNAVDAMITRDIAFQIVGDPFASRALQIGDSKPVGCGGTHVQSSADLKGLVIEKVRVRKRRLRVSYRL